MTNFNKITIYQADTSCSQGFQLLVKSPTYEITDNCYRPTDQGLDVDLLKKKLPGSFAYGMAANVQDPLIKHRLSLSYQVLQVLHQALEKLSSDDMSPVKDQGYKRSSKIELKIKDTLVQLDFDSTKKRIQANLVKDGVQTQLEVPVSYLRVLFSSELKEPKKVQEKVNRVLEVFK